MFPLSIPLALLLLSPQTPGDGGGPPVDRVVLRSGGVVEGLVVSEEGGKVVVELAPGARIELTSADVESVTRAPRPEGADLRAPAAVGKQGDTWAMVHDASGEFLGTRHLLLGPDPRDPGHLRIEETLLLQGAEGDAVRIHRIEIADLGLRPIECQYREVWSDGSITVRAVVEPEGLAVETIDDRGRRHEVVPFAVGTTFPLLLAERARRSPPGPGSEIACEVFDPFARTLVRRVIRGEGSQRIAIGTGSATPHRVFVTVARSIASTTWITDGGEIARAELNGADLVATRCTAAEAELAGGLASGAAFARDASGRVRIAVPGSHWRVGRTAAEAVSMERTDGSAEIVGFPLAAEKEATVAACALLLERRLRSTLSSFERDGAFQDRAVGSLPATRLRFQCFADGRVRAGLAVAVRGSEGSWGFVATFEPGDRDRAERELERVLQRADLRF